MNEQDKKAFSEAAKGWATKSAGKDLGEYFWQAALEYARGQQESVAFCEADLEAIARELLANEYEKHGIEGSYPTYANLARIGKGEFTLRSIRAIVAALKYTTPPAQPVQPAVNEQMLEALKATKAWLDAENNHELEPDFYNRAAMASEAEHMVDAAIAAAEAAKGGV